MAKYKLQFDARVFNPDTGEYSTGWIDPARPSELREEHTDVPTFEYETYDEAKAHVERVIGYSYEEEDRGDYIIFGADEAETDYETGEDYTYGAILEGDRD